MFKKSIILLATLAAAAGLCLAQDLATTKPAVKQTAIKQTSPASGKEMFAAYCTPAMVPTVQATVPRPLR